MAKNCAYILSALVVGIFCGWLICGRQEVQIKESIKYVYRSATKIDTDLFPEPIKVERIDLPKLQYHDTTYIIKNIPADTAGIINDYLQRRIYDLDFSTDTTGVFKVQAIVEANRLASASAQISPIHRELERIIEVQPRKFRPFVSGGFAIGDKVGVSLGLGGIIKEKHTISVKTMRIGNNNYYGGEYGYIFGK